MVTNLLVYFWNLHLFNSVSSIFKFFCFSHYFLFLGFQFFLTKWNPSCVVVAQICNTRSRLLNLTDDFKTLTFETCHRSDAFFAKFGNISFWLIHLNLSSLKLIFQHKNFFNFLLVKEESLVQIQHVFLVEVPHLLNHVSSLLLHRLNPS
jgi:hypothetical protein